MGRSEELGTGIRKVYKYSKAYSGSDEIEFLEHDTFITKVPLDAQLFEATIAKGNLTERVHGGINGGINELFKFIKKTPGKRTNEIAGAISVPAKTVEKWLAILKREGKIEFIGSKKTGGYYIK